MGEFFKWSCCQNADLRQEDNINYGVLASVATVLKHGKREDLLPYADDLFKWIIKQNYNKSKAILVRKYGIKIIQRIGKIFHLCVQILIMYHIIILIALFYRISIIEASFSNLAIYT